MILLFEKQVKQNRILNFGWVSHIGVTECLDAIQCLFKMNANE